MRREHVTLTVRHVDADDDQLPAVVLAVEEPTDLLTERLVTPDGERLDGDGVDVAFRFQTPVDAADPSGVFSLSDRVTGEFILEVNADADAILDLVGTARRDDDPEGVESCYRVHVRRDDEDVATYEKQTLLVYDDEGSLLRQHSLIPSGVEL
jgi:hypothetical protein